MTRGIFNITVLSNYLRDANLVVPTEIRKSDFLDHENFLPKAIRSDDLYGVDPNGRRQAIFHTAGYQYLANLVIGRIQRPFGPPRHGASLTLPGHDNGLLNFNPDSYREAVLSNCLRDAI